MLRKILERNKSNTLGVLVKRDGTLTAPGADILEYLMLAHFPFLQPKAPIEPNPVTMLTIKINRRKIEDMSLDNIKEAVQKYKNKKSAKPDGLKPLK